MFILAWFSATFIFLWFKDFFCFLTSLLYILTKIKSEKSTFVFKSPENKNHIDKNYYQINKLNSKNSACLGMNFIKICPEIALKYLFEKNVVLYELYSKKSKVTNTYVHGLYVLTVNVIFGGTRTRSTKWKPHNIPSSKLLVVCGKLTRSLTSDRH